MQSWISFSSTSPFLFVVSFGTSALAFSFFCFSLSLASSSEPYEGSSLSILLVGATGGFASESWNEKSEGAAGG